MLRQPEALLLDLDDTLLDGSYLAPSIRGTCEALVDAEPALSVERLVAANAEIWQDYWPEIEDAWTLGRLRSDTVRLEVWSRTLEQCGGARAELAQLAAVTHARLECESFRLFDDARELLDEGFFDVPLGLVTNGASDVQREKVQTLGIEDRFAAIVVSGEVGRRKPDPAVFRIALAEMGVEPSKAWHVGDNYSTDVVGAMSSGLRAVWLNRQGRAWDPRTAHPALEIRSLRELRDVGTLP